MPASRSMPSTVPVAALTRALAAGQKPGDLIQQLQQQGWARQPARLAVAAAQRTLAHYLHSPEGRQRLVRGYRRQVAQGVLWAGAGYSLMAWAGCSAGRLGGAQALGSGALLLGVVDILHGLIGWLYCRRARR